MSGDEAAQKAAAAAAMAMMRRHEPTGGEPAREHDHTPAALGEPRQRLTADVQSDFTPPTAARAPKPKPKPKAPAKGPRKAALLTKPPSGTNARAERSKANLEARGGRRITFNCTPAANAVLARFAAAGQEQTEIINRALVALKE